MFGTIVLAGYLNLSCAFIPPISNHCQLLDVLVSKTLKCTHFNDAFNERVRQYLFLVDF